MRMPSTMFKLADFGISQPCNITLGLTNDTMVVGNFQYMAPEQGDKRARVTDKVDIWAFATTVLSAWPGQQPYPDHSILQILSRHWKLPQGRSACSGRVGASPADGAASGACRVLVHGCNEAAHSKGSLPGVQGGTRQPQGALAPGRGSSMLAALLSLTSASNCLINTLVMTLKCAIAFLFAGAREGFEFSCQ